MGKTYPRVTELLRREFEEKKVTKYSFCKQTGINPTSVERYLHGISEPTLVSLEKIAAYFEVSVEWLRGSDEADEKILDLVDEMVSYAVGLQSLEGDELSEANEKLTEFIAKIMLLKIQTRHLTSNHKLFGSVDLDEKLVDGAKRAIKETFKKALEEIDKKREEP